MLAGAAGSLFLQSCSRQPAAPTANPHAPKPLVSVIRAALTRQDLYDTVRRILIEQKVECQGKRVVLKPNLVEFDRNTRHQHPSPAGARGASKRSAPSARPTCASPKVRAIAATRSTWRKPRAISKPCPNFEDLFTDLNLDEVSRVYAAQAVLRRCATSICPTPSWARTWWSPCPR